MINNGYESLLLDYYGPLLTEKQQQTLKLYLDYDVSLSEIAEEEDSSRQAIYDSVKKSIAALKAYEAKLGLVKRDSEQRKKIGEIIEQLKAEGEPAKKVQKALRELEKML